MNGMHNYSINSEEHKIVSFYLAILAILLAWGLSLFSDKVFSIPWWIEAPSVIGFYGILYKLFDSWFWKKEILRKIGLIKTPVVEGNWTGILNSLSQHSTGPIDIKKFKVKQTWTHIRIYLATETSESYSFEASMTVDHFDTARIHYQYMNSPKDSSPETMHMHCGSVTAKIIDSETIESEYYSGIDRNNIGSFSLKKCK